MTWRGPIPMRWAAAIGAVVLLAAARPGAARQAAPAAEIVLGMSAAFTGESSELGTNLYRGAQAYFAEVNERGGVAGRRIRIVAYDDGYEPNRTLSNTLTLFERDRVALLFGYVGTPTVTRALPLLKHFERLQPLMLFPFTGADAQRAAPYNQFSYNLRASYDQETAGLVRNLVQAGRKRIGIFYQADPYGRSVWDGVRKALAGEGLKLAAEATYRRGVPYSTDMSAQVKILQSSGVDAVITGGSYAPCAAFVRDAVNAGWTVPVASLSFVEGLRFVDLLESEGRRTGKNYTSHVINSQVVPDYEDPSIPAGREYLALMTKHRPDPPRFGSHVPSPIRPTLTGFEGFLNAKLLTEVLRRTGGETDRETMRRAFESIDGYDLGVRSPVVFGPSRTQGLDDVYYVRVEGGRFVTVTDWQAWAK